MKLNRLIENHQIVMALKDAVNTSSGSLENVAPLIRRVLKANAWRSRIVPQLGKDPVEFDSFPEFIETKPLRGCGWPLEKIPPLLKNDPVVLEMWRKATTAPVGKPGHNNNNIIIKPVQGTSLAYTLDRLKREQPDLFDKVVAKKMSANAAAIAAGFRKPPPTPLDIVLKQWPKLTAAERAQLCACDD